MMLAMTLAALLGAGLVLAVTTAYLNSIATERIPESVAPFQATLIAGMALSIGGAAMAPGVASLIAAATGVSTGGLMLYLMRIRKLPDGALIATVGAPMPPVVALDERGEGFDLASLLGRRVMVKFFRGSW